MTVILVLAMFITFVVIRRFMKRKTLNYVLQTAPREEAEEIKAQPAVASVIASSEVDRRGRAGIDRRQAERRRARAA